MNMFDRIYTVKIFEDGHFCWKASSREKTIEDYRRSNNPLLFVLAVVLLVHMYAH